MAQIGTDIQLASRLLAAGNLVAMPTETVYGLAANALDDNAVLRIFGAKGRPHFDPLIVHCPNTESAFSLAAEVPDAARRLAEAFWPGPLTLVLPKVPIIPDVVTSGLDTVGLRVPAHALAQQLLKACSFPLAAPSANPFGFVSPTSAQHVNQQLGHRVSYILDGGPSMVGLESTIVGFLDGKPTIYRLGGLSRETIEGVVGPIGLSINQSSNPVAPGQLKSHYAPKIPLYLFHEGVPAELANLRLGLIGFDRIPEGIDFEDYRLLSAQGNLHEAARNLFAALRDLGECRLDAIVAVNFPDVGLGASINDRLRRAAAR